MPTLVTVVDDDESVRESLPDLIKSFGFDVQSFSSAEEFLSSDDMLRTQCLVLDIAMPGMSGPELQRELSHRNHDIPIVFITARCSDGAKPEIGKDNAVACLIKPFSDMAIFDAIVKAIKKD